MLDPKRKIRKDEALEESPGTDFQPFHVGTVFIEKETIATI